MTHQSSRNYFKVIRNIEHIWIVIKNHKLLRNCKLLNIEDGYIKKTRNGITDSLPPHIKGTFNNLESRRATKRQGGRDNNPLTVLFS